MQKYEAGLVSVVVPAFNYAQYLNQALDSVLNQAGILLEVIVVDDGSIDSTPDIIASYGSQLRSTRQNNQGLSAARNAGIILARGEFIVFLDSDDILFPDVLASQQNILRSNADTDMVVCRSILFNHVDDSGIPVQCGQWRLFQQDMDVHLCHFNIAPSHAFMTRRLLIDRIGMFDTGLKACEDHDFWFRAVAGGARLKANPKTGVAYRRHDHSMSCNETNQWRHDAILHARIGAEFAGNTRFLHAGRLEGLIAHIAGCLFTSKRLETIDPDESWALRLLAMRTATILSCESPKPQRRPETLSYLLNRIHMAIHGINDQDKRWVDELCGILRKVVSAHCPNGDAILDTYPSGR